MKRLLPFTLIHVPLEPIIFPMILGTLWSPPPLPLTSAETSISPIIITIHFGIKLSSEERCLNTAFIFHLLSVFSREGFIWFTSFRCCKKCAEKGREVHYETQFLLCARLHALYHMFVEHNNERERLLAKTEKYINKFFVYSVNYQVDFFFLYKFMLGKESSHTVILFISTNFCIKKKLT